MTFIKDLYRSLFGKSYSAVWKRFALEKGGEYAPVSDERVLVVYKDFGIVLDAYTHYIVVGHSSYESEYIRGIVELGSLDYFSLLITQQGFIENMSKLFGAQDIEINERNFDKRFMVKSNDELKIQLFLANAGITNCLLDFKTIRFHLTQEEGLWGEKPREGNWMLYFVAQGKVKHPEELELIYKLLTSSIDALLKLNVIKAVT